MCESRYSFKTRIFKKIKVMFCMQFLLAISNPIFVLTVSQIWNFIPGKLPKLVARESPLVLKRFPSVFSRKQLSGSEEMEPGSDQVEDGMEVEEDASMEVDRDAGNTSVDVLEMSFCENLEVNKAM